MWYTIFLDDPDRSGMYTFSLAGCGSGNLLILEGGEPIECECGFYDSTYLAPEPKPWIRTAVCAPPPAEFVGSNLKFPAI